jgi:hypothetical protein
VAPMEPWQRVWIDAEQYAQDIHSRINCTSCHQGTAVADMDSAHQGMNPNPAEDPETCGTCHPDVVPANANSLHTTLRGYDTTLYERSTPENHSAIEEMEANHCASCHTTCGDCHVSQPGNVGSGLLEGHVFKSTPPMSQTCTACHGSRVKNEYFGLNEGIPGDVHFRERMACSDCHTADEIHGVAQPATDHRYTGDQMPTCESCHEGQVGVGSGIEQHEIHGTEILSCQACHSTTYTNCVNCHVEKADNGTPFYTIESSSLEFYLGRNPLRGSDRPYRYVPVRHVPADANSFSFYGENLLSNFDNRPTWVYTTPHNIQRNTPQTETCASCHGNDEIFLTADKVATSELAANADVIVDHAPPLPEGGEAPPAESATPSEDSGDGFWGSDSAATPEATAAKDSSDDFWGSDSTATPEATAAKDSSDDFWGSDSAATPEATAEANKSDNAFWSN